MSRITATCTGCRNTVVLPEGVESGFCPRCGSPVDAAAAEAAPHAVTLEKAPRSETDPFEFEPYSPAARQPEARQKPQRQKRRIKPWIIAAAAAVAVIAIAGAAWFFFLSGGNSYARAEASFFKEIFNAAPVSSSQGSQGKQIDITASYVSRDYIGIPDMKLDASIQTAKGQAAAVANLTADDDKLSNVTFAYDGSYATLSLPDITDYYLKFLTSGNSDDKLDFSKLDTNQLKKTMEEVAKSYFKQVEKHADVDKGVELSAGDMTVKCDKYTIDFTGEFVGEIMKESMSAVKKNRNLVSFLGDLSEQIYSDEDKLMDEIEEYIDELRDGRNSRDSLFRMTVWIKDSKVISRKIDRIANDSDSKISYLWYVSGKAAYIDFDFRAGRSFSASMKGSFEKGRDGWSGSPKATITDNYDSYSFKIAFKDLQTNGGKLTGSVKAAGTIDDTPFDISLKFDNKNNQQTISLSGEIDRDDIGKWSLSYGSKEISNVSMPKLDREYEVLGYSMEDYDTKENYVRGKAMRDDIEKASLAYRSNSLFNDILRQVWNAAPYSYSATASNPPNTNPPNGTGGQTGAKNPVVTITMENGKQIVAELYPDKAPNTVNNFIYLANFGYYDGLTFHRVVPDFVIQGGDPSGDGTGGPGYKIEGEFKSNGFAGNDLSHLPGVLSMARAVDYDSAGSQFFICAGDATFLDGNYAAFGMVTSGMDEVYAISKMNSGDGPPSTRQVMRTVTVDTFGVKYPEPARIPDRPQPSPSPSPSSSPRGEIGLYDPDYDYSRNPRYKIAYFVENNASGLYTESDKTFAHWAEMLNCDYDGLCDFYGDNDRMLALLPQLAKDYDGLIIDINTTMYDRVYEIMASTGTPWMSFMAPPRDYGGTGALMNTCVDLEQFDVGAAHAEHLLTNCQLKWAGVPLSEYGIICTDFSGIPALNQREQGFLSYLFENQPDLAYNNYFVTDISSFGFSADDAQMAVSTVLAMHPEFTRWLVFGMFDIWAQGAAEAIDQFGYTDTSWVTAFGGSALIAQWDSGRQTAWRSACFLPTSIFAEPVIGALYAYMNGDATPETVFPEWHDKHESTKYGTFAKRKLPWYPIYFENYKHVCEWSDVYSGTDIYPYDSAGITRDDFSTSVPVPASYR